MQQLILQYFKEQRSILNLKHHSPKVHFDQCSDFYRHVLTGYCSVTSQQSSKHILLVPQGLEAWELHFPESLASRILRFHQKEAPACDLKGRKEAESTLPRTAIQTFSAMASATACFLGFMSTLRLQMEYRQKLPTIFGFLGRLSFPLSLLVFPTIL